MDPFTGHWVIDLQASQFVGPVPAEWSHDIEASADSIRGRERVVGSDGTVSEYSLEARFDGAEYPVTGSPVVDTMSYARPNLRRIDGAGHKAGKVIFLEVVVVTEDGQTLTMAIAVPRADGTTGEAVLVFRLAGPPVAM